jgi:hypothetical protein
LKSFQSEIIAVAPKVAELACGQNDLDIQSSDENSELVKCVVSANNQFASF